MIGVCEYVRLMCACAWEFPDDGLLLINSSIIKITHGTLQG